MSVQLLDRTRKINKLLHNNHASKVLFNDICEVMVETLDSNILVMSRKGKVLGVGPVSYTHLDYSLSKNHRRPAWIGRACCWCPRRYGQAIYQEIKLPIGTESTAAGCNYWLCIQQRKQVTNALTIKNFIKLREKFKPGSSQAVLFRKNQANGWFHTYLLFLFLDVKHRSAEPFVHEERL